MGLQQAQEDRYLAKFVDGLLNRISRLEDRVRQVEANEDSNFNVISNQSIINNASAVEVLNRSIKAKTMGDDGTTGFRLVVVVNNNTGAPQNVTIVATFGGVTIFSRTESVGFHATNRATLEAEVELSNAISHTSQRYIGTYKNTAIAAANTLTAFANHMRLWGTITSLDTEINDYDLIVTVQNGVADPNMASRVTASYFLKQLPLTSL